MLVTLINYYQAAPTPSLLWLHSHSAQPKKNKCWFFVNVFTPCGCFIRSRFSSRPYCSMKKKQKFHQKDSFSENISLKNFLWIVPECVCVWNRSSFSKMLFRRQIRIFYCRFSNHALNWMKIELWRWAPFIVS